MPLLRVHALSPLLLLVGLGLFSRTEATPVLLPTARHESPPAAPNPWVGTVKATLSMGSGITGTYEITGTVRFEFSNSVLQQDEYHLASGQFTWTANGVDDSGCTYTGGPVTVSESQVDEPNLIIEWSDSTYTGSIYSNELAAAEVLVTCPDGSYTVPNLGWTPFLVLGYSPSQVPYKMTSDGTYAYMDGTLTSDDGDVWEWHLSNRPAGGEEVVVKLQGDNGVSYEDWRPGAGPDEKTSGSVLDITATLQNKDGSPIDREAESFTFELVAGYVSRLPGVAINFPQKDSARTSLDFSFDQDLNPDGEVSSDSLRAEMPGGKEAQATLTSYDWGGYAILRVTAHMPGGDDVVGYLEGVPDMTDIPVPKTSGSSFIADGWKSEHSVEQLTDDDDGEGDPVGDGDVGDGLTLFEEYRGFIENGSHTSGDPTKKDFFIRDDLGGGSKQGIALFQSLTGLRVHHEFRTSEFVADTSGTRSENRVINANHGDAPHEVDQHGVWLVSGKRKSASVTVGGPGVPAQIEQVQLSAAFGGASDWRMVRRGNKLMLRNEFTSTIAHELGHSVNVWHHGETDRQATWSIEQDAGGGVKRDANQNLIILENGTARIQVKKENGLPGLTLALLQALTDSTNINMSVPVWVGLKGGLHSGNEECIMRYDVAKAYPSTTDPTVRYWVSGDELTGYDLCKSPAGTGVNDAGHKPESRYGDAASSVSEGPTQRGNCFGQICVNDKYGQHAKN